MSLDNTGGRRAGRGCRWFLLVGAIIVIALLLLGLFFSLIYTSGNTGR